jgi:hypothetical protein
MGCTAAVFGFSGSTFRDVKKRYRKRGASPDICSRPQSSSGCSLLSQRIAPGIATVITEHISLQLSSNTEGRHRDAAIGPQEAVKKTQGFRPYVEGSIPVDSGNTAPSVC